MPSAGRTIGLILAVAMFVFSVWMYSKTGDWVAILFAVGSAGYTMFFFSGMSKDKPS